MGQPRIISKISQYFMDLNLRSQLLAAFLLLALIPLLLLSYFFYEYSKQIIVTEATERLQVIAERQAKQIRNYFDEQEHFVTGLALFPAIATEVNQFSELFKKGGVNTPEYQKLYKDFYEFLSSYQLNAGFEDLFLISSSGDILFSMRKGADYGSNLRSGLYKDTDLAKVYDNAATLLELQSSDFNYYSNSNEPAAFLGAPIIDKKHNDLVGVIVLQLNNADIYRVVNQYLGLGETGETVILSKAGDTYTFMTPTRFDPFAAFKRTVGIKDERHNFIKKIAEGQETTEVYKDYRDKEVLAYGKYFLPSLGWNIIVKMDTAELFKPIELLKWFLTLALLTMIGLILASVFTLTKTIHKPIAMLTDYTRKIAAGNLDLRIPVNSKNEIGVLSSEFNQMSVQLQEIIQTLESKVEERTVQIKEKNDELSKSLDELKIMQKRMIAQEKLASLGGLTAGIAHEIKNPLNFINNFSILTIDMLPYFEAITEKIKPNLSKEEVEELQENMYTLKDNLNMIYEQGNRTNNIVQRMLSHSRGVEGKAKPYNIHQLLNEAIDLSYHGFRVQFPTFNTAISKEFHDSNIELTILGDDISRVFINVLNNAFYAVNQKSLQKLPFYNPDVSIKTNIVGSNFVILIHDNGVGIPTNIQNRLFSPFFTTKPTGEGTGLGLSLAYSIIVDTHGGSITCESVEGEYTEFTISLPLNSPQKQKAPNRENEINPTTDRVGE